MESGERQPDPSALSSRLSPRYRTKRQAKEVSYLMELEKLEKLRFAPAQPRASFSRPSTHPLVGE